MPIVVIGNCNCSNTDSCNMECDENDASGHINNIEFSIKEGGSHTHHHGSWFRNEIKLSFQKIETIDNKKNLSL